MVKKFPSSDPDALRKWLESHKNDDKVEVEGVLVPIVADASIELSGHVHRDDYNSALKYASPWGCKKTGIGCYGILLLTLNPSLNIVSPQNTKTYASGDEDSRLFRCSVPTGTLDILRNFNKQYKLNRSQLATLVLRSFANNERIQQIYADWLKKWCEITGLSAEEIEEIVFSFYRIDGTVKRYNLAKIGDPEAGAEKLS